MELPADGEGTASNRLLIRLGFGGWYATCTACLPPSKSKEVPDDLMVMDYFEKYMGSAAVLGTKWAVNKDAGCSINISIDTAAEGMDGAAYKAEYKETATGWADATVNKEADWSKANALQFKTIPNGNNQLAVIQITASGKVSCTIWYDSIKAVNSGKTEVTIE